MPKLTISQDSIFTKRLELRRTRVEDAAAMFEALKHPDTYTYLPRTAPESVAEVTEHFARVMHETAPDRAEQWFNWTVWLRETGAPLGTIEATEGGAQFGTQIGYLFDPRVWRNGFASEAVAAMVDELAEGGAIEFRARIDIRNEASKALVKRLRFRHGYTEGLDEHWKRSTGSIVIHVTDNESGAKREIPMSWEDLCDGAAVGTHPDCTVCLDDASMLPVHARIQPVSHHTVLYVFADGSGTLPFERISSPTPHYHSRVDRQPFTLGRHTLQVQWLSYEETKARHR